MIILVRRNKFRERKKVGVESLKASVWKMQSNLLGRDES